MRLAPNNYCDYEIDQNPLWNHILSERPEVIKLIVGILDQKHTLMSFQEAVNLFRCVERTSHLPGEIAECGTYRGGSAAIMAHANKSRKTMRLFDTWEGLPEVTEGVDKLKVGEIGGMDGRAGLQKTLEMLKGFDDIVRYHIGFFPSSARDIPETARFSLVNLDMDTYVSTLEGLKFFYPRMTRGGVIVCHDYWATGCPGVKMAVDEFFADKPETIMDLWHSQIAVSKC